jgi:hypothetical protein
LLFSRVPPKGGWSQSRFLTEKFAEGLHLLKTTMESHLRNALVAGFKPLPGLLQPQLQQVLVGRLTKNRFKAPLKVVFRKISRCGQCR